MNWKTKLRGYIGDRLMHSADAVRGKPAPEVESVNKADINAEKDAIDRRLIQILNISGNEDTLVDDIQVHIRAYGNYYGQLGFYHGRSGARDFHILSTARTHASLITGRIKSALSGHVEALTFLNDQKKKSLSKLDERQGQNAQELLEQEALAMNDSKQFSKTNAIVYIIAGLAMILADVAVSINLVAFFGIGHPKANAGFWDKIMDKELFFFSMGIALCTIFIKIFYDEYINSKLGNMQFQFNKLELKGALREMLRKELIAKFIVKMLILTGLLFLLYYLARYRTYFTVYSTEYATINKMKTLAKGQASDIVPVILNSFIGITVIIPVISGIALSMGLKIFSNISAYKKTVENEKNSLRHCQDAEAEVQTLTYKLKNLDKSLEEWSESDVKMELLSVFFVQSYTQGFRVSYRQNHKNDLYSLIEEYRNEVINQAFTKRLKPLS